MEKLEIVSPETGHPTGLCLPRNEAIQQRLWCRTTNIFVLNAKGEVLCHQRSLQKERLPGLWVTHLGGHVASDETYESNALKELAEEAGIVVEPRQMVHWRTTRLDSARLWMREFVVLCDVDADRLVPQPGEVERFAWRSPQQILKAKQIDPEGWCAGTHDFATEYMCLRAALNAADAVGAFQTPPQLYSWMPLV